MDARLWNILQLGIAFMMVFSAFNSSGFIEEIVIDTVHNISKHDSSVANVNQKAGYYSLAIIYAVFTFANFLAPPIVSAISAKWAMVLGAACYGIFMAGFLHVMEWFLYLSSGILGFGAAIIWTAQGNYLTLNSDSETIGRNSGILWALLQSALILGGVFLYFMFHDQSSLSMATIRIIYIIFTCLTASGAVVMALLRRPPPSTTSPEFYSAERTPLISDSDSDTPTTQNDRDMLVESISAENPAVVDSVVTLPKQQERDYPTRNKYLVDFLSTFKLLFTRQMALLAVVFAYSGIETTFWTGVYGTCLGFTKRFTSSKNELVALNGIFLGIGETIGGGLFGIFGHRTNKYGRNPIIILGTVCHMVAFFLVFVNIPMDAPLGQTDEMSYMEPNKYLALFCSFMLGFADSCWNTQIYSLLGSLYPNDSAPAFALFKFFQSAAACGSFYYGSALLLHWQLLILAVGSFIGALCFFPVEWEAQTRPSGIKVA